jgi:hypothetical protein
VVVFVMSMDADDSAKLCAVPGGLAGCGVTAGLLALNWRFHPSPFKDSHVRSPTTLDVKNKSHNQIIAILFTLPLLLPASASLLPRPARCSLRARPVVGSPAG